MTDSPVFLIKYVYFLEHIKKEEISNSLGPKASRIDMNSCVACSMLKRQELQTQWKKIRIQEFCLVHVLPCEVHSTAIQLEPEPDYVIIMDKIEYKITTILCSSILK